MMMTARRPEGELAMHLPVHDLAGYFGGPWSLIRRIADRRSGATGRFKGRATFAPTPYGLRYDERGTLIHGSFRGEATRSLRFLTSGHSAVADVRFDDGRPFHAFDLSSGITDVEHDCGSDRYRGRYRLCGRNSWALDWRVEGPRKRMLIGARYVRL
jgi:Family of unknown function (DUF6314)